MIYHSKLRFSNRLYFLTSRHMRVSQFHGLLFCPKTLKSFSWAMLAPLVCLRERLPQETTETKGEWSTAFSFLEYFDEVCGWMQQESLQEAILRVCGESMRNKKRKKTQIKRRNCKNWLRLWFCLQCISQRHSHLSVTWLYTYRV